MKSSFCFKTKCLALMALLLTGLSGHTQIAVWDFEPLQGTLNNPTANMGSGTASIVNNGGSITPMLRTGMAGSGCGNQNGVQAWAFEPFDAGSLNESCGAQFKMSTATYQNIYFTWDQRWSNTAPNTVRLQYTVNGSTWINFNMTSGNTSFCNGSINANGCFETNVTGDQYRRISVNLSAMTGVNNNANFGVRLVAAHYQSTGEFRRCDSPGTLAGNAGTWRFDNVTVTGTLMPGPNPSVMTGTSATCFGTPVNIKVNITGGTSPYTLVYTDGVSNFTVLNYISNSNIPVNPVSTRTYSIVSVTDANNIAGTGNSGAATITVNALPTVTATNISTCSTAAIALSGGSPAGGTYSIPNPYSGPTTTFTYTYTNGNGCTKTSAAYTFTRNVAPTINTQPSPAAQTVCQGDAFTPVSVVAAGSGTITYQWYSNVNPTTTGGLPLTTAAHIANGSKTDTYTPLSTAMGTLYYYVVVTNSCTSIKSGNASGAYTVTSPSVAGALSSNQIICAASLPGDVTLSGQTGTVVKWQKAFDNGFTVGVSDIASSATTLAGSLVGPVNQTTYLRAVVQNGSCAAVTTTPIEILIKSTVWNGSWSNGVPDQYTTTIFTTDYSSAGDLEACSVVVNSGSVVFNPGHTLKVQNGLAVAGGNLTFEDTASLLQVNNAANSGPITYKRQTTPMLRYDYTYWSSPVATQILASLSPNTLFDKYFWWNTSIYNWSAVTAPGITLMDIGKGYIIRAPQNFDPATPAVFEGIFNGTPNNGDYAVPIAVAGSNDMNLIGNPYPSALSADAFMADPSNAAALGTGTSIYLWTHNSPILNYEYTANDYATYNYTGGTGTAPAAASGTNNNLPNGYIAAGQAFMIKGIANGTAWFKNSMRVGNNNDQFFRSAALHKERLWLEFKNTNGAYKQLLVGYIENATNGFDAGFDAEAIEAGNSVSFYSIQDDRLLAIQGRSLPFENADLIPLGYRATSPGNYEIGLSQFDQAFDQRGVYLEDLLLQQTYDLKQGTYTFATQSGVFDHRFVLRFTNNTLAVNHSLDAAQTVVVYKTAAGIGIDSGQAQMQTISVYDLTGRFITSKIVNATTAVLPIAVASEMLLVKVNFSDGRVIYKKMAI